MERHNGIPRGQPNSIVLISWPIIELSSLPNSFSHSLTGSVPEDVRKNFTRITLDWSLILQHHSKPLGPKVVLLEPEPWRTQGFCTSLQILYHMWYFSQATKKCLHKQFGKKPKKWFAQTTQATESWTCCGLSVAGLRLEEGSLARASSSHVHRLRHSCNCEQIGSHTQIHLMLSGLLAHFLI